MTSNPSVESVSNFTGIIVPLGEKSDIKKTESIGDFKSPNFVIDCNKKTGRNFSRRQIVILCVLIITNILAGNLSSLQAPFFPEVARSKGASATQYGFVFGIFEFTNIIASPFFGSNIKTLGIKRVFAGGILTAGTSALMFGSLNKIQGSTYKFIASCLIVRILEAIGESAFVTASFAISATEFPDAVASTAALLETCFVLGLSVGPVLGGFLYELGGYNLPFQFMGGSLFIASLMVWMVLPSDYAVVDNYKESIGDQHIRKNPPKHDSPCLPLKHQKTLDLIKVPVITITASSIVIASTGSGFIGVSLESHLQQFKLDKIAVGSVFLLRSLVYVITAPFWGYICDRIKNPKLLTVPLFGSIVCLLGLLLIGPLPLLPLEPAIWSICVGQMLFGLGTGTIYTSGFKIFLNDMIDRGYPDDVSTNGLAAGLWKSMLSTGFFIGPIVGGVLEDLVGFRWGSLFLMGPQCIIVIILIIYLMKTWPRNIPKEYVSQSSADKSI